MNSFCLITQSSTKSEVRRARCSFPIHETSRRSACTTFAWQLEAAAELPTPPAPAALLLAGSSSRISQNFPYRALILKLTACVTKIIVMYEYELHLRICIYIFIIEMFLPLSRYLLKAIFM